MSIYGSLIIFCMSSINRGFVLVVEWLRNSYHNIKNIRIFILNSVAYGYTGIPPVKRGAPLCPL